MGRLGFQANCGGQAPRPLSNIRWECPDARRVRRAARATSTTPQPSDPSATGCFGDPVRARVVRARRRLRTEPNGGSGELVDQLTPWGPELTPSAYATTVYT